MMRFYKNMFLILIFISVAARAHAVQQEIPILFFDVSNTGALVGVDDSGRLYYSIDWPNASVVAKSPLGVMYDGVDLGDGVSLGEPEYENIEEIFQTSMNHSMGYLDCNLAKIPVTHEKSGVKYELEFRVCEDGAAFRYVIPGQGEHVVGGEATGFTFDEGVYFWHQNNVGNYEDVYERTTAPHAGEDIGMPMTVEFPNGWYAAISESAVIGYSGMTLKVAEGGREFKAAFLDDPDGWKIDGDVVSPWRVVLIAPDLNALVNADLVWALSPEPDVDVATADWIRPGRSLWSWLNGGRPSVTPDEMRMYVDAASELGFEYLLVDDGWENPPPVWEGKKAPGWTNDEQTDMEIMADLVKYAKEKGVGIWVWKHYQLIADPEYREKFFSDLERIGVVGVKIDFMDSESVEMLQFYEDCLSDAFSHKLMINFHGANKPTGEARRWPNEMAREGIRGLEYRNQPPEHVTALPFTRLLAGHADYTPMHFNPIWMFTTTASHQLASTIIFASPVTFYGAHPQDLLRSQARPIIEKLPVLFDQTIVLPDSSIGRLAAFARRSGDTWFVAVMNAGAGRKMKISLDFLPEGEFEVNAYMDSSNAQSFKKAKKLVTENDSLPIVLKANGGFVAIIEKVK